MIRTLLVVEVPFYRQGLAELLNRSGIAQVVATAGSAATAESAARAEPPDAALVDAGLADCAEAVSRLRSLPVPPRMVLLAMNESPEAILGWIEHGIAAYVSRDATLHDLLRVLEGVAHEEFECPPKLASHLMRRVASLASAPRPSGDSRHGLSPREHEVLRLLARGLPNKAIANRLSISNATAKNHVHNILEKLRLHRRSEVASLVMGDSERRSA